jgi:hypothetical protein
MPWKNRRFTLFTSYCHIEELEVFNPDLAEQIKKSPKFYSDGLYNYRLKTDSFVFRILKADAKDQNSMYEPPAEKHRKRPDKQQQQLEVII